MYVFIGMVKNLNRYANEYLQWGNIMVVWYWFFHAHVISLEKNSDYTLNFIIT